MSHKSWQKIGNKWRLLLLPTQKVGWTFLFVAEGYLAVCGIDSVSAVVDLETNDSRKLTMQETQCKDLDTLDVIEDARSKRKTFPLIIQNSLISIIFNDGIRTMSALFHLKLIHKSWLWSLIAFCVICVLNFVIIWKNPWKFCLVFRTDRFLDCLMLWCAFYIFYVVQMTWCSYNYCRAFNKFSIKWMNSSIG
jgi:hypothetical protein